MAVKIARESHFAFSAERFLDGKVTPFLGAGANLCGRPEDKEWKWTPGCEYLPGGKELAMVLAKKGHYPLSNPERPDLDLMRISQFVHSVGGWGTLYEFLRAQFNATYKPTVLHYFLADVAILLRERNKDRQVILTANYDDALEKAFDERHEPYDLIWYQAQPERKHCGYFIHARREGPENILAPQPILAPNDYDELEPDKRTVIVKMHGAMVREPENCDSYVITEDDYIRYLTRSDVTSQLPAVLHQRITERHLLFLGYGMRDWNLRVVLERLGGSEVMAMQAWCVQVRPDTEADEEIEEQLWGDRDVQLVYMLLDDYVDKLRAQMGLLAAPS